MRDVEIPDLIAALNTAIPAGLPFWVLMSKYPSPFPSAKSIAQPFWWYDPVDSRLTVEVTIGLTPPCEAVLQICCKIVHMLVVIFGSSFRGRCSVVMSQPACWSWDIVIPEAPGSGVVWVPVGGTGGSP